MTLPHKSSGAPALAAALAALTLATPALPRDKENPAVIISAEAPAPEQKLTSLGRTFVPLHSTLIGQGGVTRLNFSGSLSIHNASANDVLAVQKIDYRSGTGQVVESYLAEPVYLKPYASIQVVVAQDDVRAGVGASFTVDWAKLPGGDEPSIEAVMAAFTGTRSYSFIATGRRVSRPQ
jgi:hypothetical protein